MNERIFAAYRAHRVRVDRRAWRPADPHRPAPLSCQVGENWPVW